MNNGPVSFIGYGKSGHWEIEGVSKDDPKWYFGLGHIVSWNPKYLGGIEGVYRRDVVIYNINLSLSSSM